MRAARSLLLLCCTWFASCKPVSQPPQILPHLDVCVLGHAHAADWTALQRECEEAHKDKSLKQSLNLKEYADKANKLFLVAPEAGLREKRMTSGGDIYARYFFAELLVEAACDQVQVDWEGGRGYSPNADEYVLRSLLIFLNYLKREADDLKSKGARIAGLTNGVTVGEGKEEREARENKEARDSRFTVIDRAYDDVAIRIGIPVGRLEEAKMEIKVREIFDEVGVQRQTIEHRLVKWR